MEKVKNGVPQVPEEFKRRRRRATIFSCWMCASRTNIRLRRSADIDSAERSAEACGRTGPRQEHRRPLQDGWPQREGGRVPEAGRVSASA